MAKYATGWLLSAYAQDLQTHESVTVLEQGTRPETDATTGLPLPGARRTPVVTWVLLGVNALVWLATTAASATTNSGILLDFGAMFGPRIANGEYWRLFTATFLHAGVAHLAINGLWLLILGQLVERAFGHVRFLVIYVLAGLSGSVASYLFNPIAVGLGASGAVFGVMGALAAFFVALRGVSGGMARRNLTGVLVIAGIILAYGFISRPGPEDPDIDNWAHLGGLVGGFLVGLALAPRYRPVPTPFGTPPLLVDANSLLRRWWVLPVAVAALALGVRLGNATLPDNAYTRVQQAEQYYNDASFEKALEELDRAVTLDPTNGVARYVRGRVFAEIGNFSGAISELGAAVRFGDPDTRDKAGALLVTLGRRR